MKTFVLSDESLNSYGFWLPTAGADLDQFKKNPIMLWMHNRSWRGTSDEVLPIGYWDNIRIEGGKIMADAIFDQEDEFAQKIESKVESSILRMASAGIRVIETSTDPKWLKPGQTSETPTKWKMREASIVDIGSNNNALALALYDENDKMIDLAAADQPFPLKKLDELTDTPTNADMKKVALMLNLADGANEEQVMAAVQSLKDKLVQAETAQTTAETKLADYEKKAGESRKAESKELLDAAVKDGRLNAETRPSWENLFEKDHESAKTTLASIPKRASTASKLGEQADKNKSERETLAKLSWDELDKQGKLKTLKENHPDLYEEKFEQRFKKKPNK